MRHPEAIELAEEAYILASETNGPVHPLVQKVATQLVDCLISSGDVSKANDFCRINCENLIDPLSGVDPESKDVACCMMQLAKIWTRTVSYNNRLEEPEIRESKTRVAICFTRVILREDREAGALSEGPEALRLARKALSIVESCRDSYSKAILPYLNVLYDVLRMSGDPNAETEEISYQILAINAEYDSVRLRKTS